MAHLVLNYPAKRPKLRQKQAEDRAPATWREAPPPSLHTRPLKSWEIWDEVAPARKASLEWKSSL